MLEKRTESRLFTEMQALVEKSGFSLVDLQTAIVHSELKVSMVIYRPEGVTISDCTTVHRLVLPRIEMLEESRDVSLEVSSPGVGRKLRYEDEFDLFQGRAVKVLLENESEWVIGTVESVEDRNVVIAVGSGETDRVPLDQIKKAKLYFSKEVK